MEINNKTPFLVEALPFKGPGDKDVLTVMLKGTFQIVNERNAQPAPEQLPIYYGDKLYDDENGGDVKFESDIAPFKPRADIVLVGRACVPGGAPVQIMDVMLRVGGLKKILRVFGDRYWQSSRLLNEHPSEPKPFSSMDLTYDRAFGGLDLEGGGWCPENLSGKGYISPSAKKSPDKTPLPNIENPKHLIKQPGDHPKPAGFAFYGKAWEPRVGYMGTFDETWRKTRSPSYPVDFRFDFYNAAHPELQVDGYLIGDEEIELLNISPERRLAFRLPGYQIGCDITTSFENFPKEERPPRAADNPSGKLEAVKMNLDTLCLIPDEKLLYIVWRGLFPLMDSTAMEVKTVNVEERKLER